MLVCWQHRICTEEECINPCTSTGFRLTRYESISLRKDAREIVDAPSKERGPLTNLNDDRDWWKTKVRSLLGK